MKCKNCKVKLKKSYIGDTTEHWDYVIACPKCHVVWDMIEKAKQ